MGFIAGPYSGTVLLSAVETSIGITERGFFIEEILEEEEIVGDNLGVCDQDGVYLGGKMFVNFVAQEADNAAIQKLIYPHVSAPDTIGNRGIVGVPGQLSSAQCCQLTLTSLYSDAPADAFEHKYVFHSVKLANRHVVEKALRSGHRKVPLRLKVYATTVSNVNRWYTVSAAS